MTECCERRVLVSEYLSQCAAQCRSMAYNRRICINFFLETILFSEGSVEPVTALVGFYETRAAFGWSILIVAGSNMDRPI